MPRDMEAVVLAGNRDAWGTSSRAVETGRAMMAVAGGPPANWRDIAERARQRKESGG